MVAVAAKATTKREVGPPVTLFLEGFLFSKSDPSPMPDELCANAPAAVAVVVVDEARLPMLPI